MAQKFWTVKEIAAACGVHADTISRRYAALIEEAKESGKAKLKDLQWARALGDHNHRPSDKLLLHMSKHYMNQHDKLEQKIVHAEVDESSPLLTDVYGSIKGD